MSWLAIGQFMEAHCAINGIRTSKRLYRFMVFILNHFPAQILSVANLSRQISTKYYYNQDCLERQNVLFTQTLVRT